MSEKFENLAPGQVGTAQVGTGSAIGIGQPEGIEAEDFREFFGGVVFHICSPLVGGVQPTPRVRRGWVLTTGYLRWFP